MEAYRIPLLSFAEGCDTTLLLNFSARIVPQDSSGESISPLRYTCQVSFVRFVADPGFGKFHLMPELNHLDICKPCDQEDWLYRRTLAFMRRCLSAGRGSTMQRTDDVTS